MEAKHAEKHFENHCQHLLIHGCLHLLGFSHYYNEDAVLMERIEKKIEKKLHTTDDFGVPSKYVESAGFAYLAYKRRSEIFFPK